MPEVHFAGRINGWPIFFSITSISDFRSLSLRQETFDSVSTICCAPLVRSIRGIVPSSRSAAQDLELNDSKHLAFTIKAPLYLLRRIEVRIQIKSAEVVVVSLSDDDAVHDFVEDEEYCKLQARLDKDLGRKSSLDPDTGQHLTFEQ